MKRVLFLTNIASPYRVHFYDELAKHMDVTVLYTDRAEDTKDRSADWFIAGTGAYRPVQLKRRVARIGGETLCPDVIGWLKKPYDAIVICGYSSPTAMLAMAWLRRKKIPFYLEADGGLIRQEGKGKFRFKKSLVSMADFWLSSGRYTTEFLVHYGAREDRVFSYPFSSVYEKDILPAVLSAEEKRRAKAELGVSEGQMVLSVGQFIPRKGFDILMRAASALDRSIGFYIVGGEPTEEYRRLRDTLGLENVHFVGFRKKEALDRYYRAADLFVLPTREDIWGLVINEAMAFGLPVITTDRCVAGLELVTDKVNGGIVPVENADALARKIREVLASDLEEMGRRSLETIRPYTIENMAKVHEQILGR
ncbi:MAG: glycosyltransferase family 4 protein [Firmicutes bacterium]|nr:glycosyltransferase family 4 protein [Bacillota bacterium]